MPRRIPEIKGKIRDYLKMHGHKGNSTILVKRGGEVKGVGGVVILPRGSLGKRIHKNIAVKVVMDGKKYRHELFVPVTEEGKESIKRPGQELGSSTVLWRKHEMSF